MSKFANTFHICATSRRAKKYATQNFSESQRKKQIICRNVGERENKTKKYIYNLSEI